MSFRIEYKDNQLDVIELINKKLKKENVPVHFDSDGLSHDGFEIYFLIKDVPKNMIFSNKICDYCQGCPYPMDGNCLEFDRFQGRKLTDC
jgi:hypothetical protein